MYQAPRINRSFSHGLAEKQRAAGFPQGTCRYLPAKPMAGLATELPQAPGKVGSLLLFLVFSVLQAWAEALGARDVESKKVLKQLHTRVSTSAGSCTFAATVDISGSESVKVCPDRDVFLHLSLP